MAYHRAGRMTTVKVALSKRNCQIPSNCIHVSLKKMFWLIFEVLPRKCLRFQLVIENQAFPVNTNWIKLLVQLRVFDLRGKGRIYRRSSGKNCYQFWRGKLYYIFSRAIPEGDTKITAVTHSLNCNMLNVLWILFKFPYVHSDLFGGDKSNFSQDGGVVSLLSPPGFLPLFRSEFQVFDGSKPESNVSCSAKDCMGIQTTQTLLLGNSL